MQQTGFMELPCRKRGIHAGIRRFSREPAYPVAEGMNQYGRRKKGFFKRLVSGLTKTRDNIVAGFDSIFSGFPVLMMIFMKNWKRS